MVPYSPVPNVTSMARRQRRQLGIAAGDTLKLQYLRVAPCLDKLAMPVCAVPLRLRRKPPLGEGGVGAGMLAIKGHSIHC
jgi:hypothetical protein